jgi:hypothetical protein
MPRRARVFVRGPRRGRALAAPRGESRQRPALTQHGPAWPPGPTCRRLGVPDPGGRSVF